MEDFDPNDILMVKQEINDNDQHFSENYPDSKSSWKTDQSNSETNKDFEKWLDLIETYEIDQYAKRTVKSIKDWFTLIPNEDNMKKSAVRCKLCYENYNKISWTMSKHQKTKRSQLSTYEGYLPNSKVQFSAKVSKHTARGSIHQQIAEWLKTGSLNDIGCRPEAKISKENFDRNINNFNKDETEEENGRVPPENSKN